MSREQKLWNLFCVAIGNYRSAESTLIFESNANIQYQLNKLDEEVKKMADEFEEALWQPPAEQWIPCSERLPEEQGYYLVTYDFGGGKRVIGKSFYSELYNRFTTGQKSAITAWMPLPEPYKGGE